MRQSARQTTSDIDLIGGIAGCAGVCAGGGDELSL